MTHAYEAERDAWVKAREEMDPCPHESFCTDCLRDAWDAGYAKAHAP